MKQKILATILTLLLLAACQTNTEEEIKIGWIGPLTGQSAVLGMDSVTAAQIAVDEINEKGGINGKHVQLIVEDDQYNTGKTVSSYQKLVNNDGVKIIIVNTYGGIFAIADMAKQDGVILVDPLDCNSVLAKLNDNVFCLATDSESLAMVLAGYAETNNYKKAGILYFNSDTFMPLIKDVFTQEFTKSGGTVISEAHVAGTTDFKTSILKMQREGIDTLVLLGYDETGIAMKQARDLGYEGEFLTTGTVTSPSLQEAAQGNAEGTVLAFWTVDKESENVQEFTEEFMEQKGRPPILDLATYPSYDAVMAVAYAIENDVSLLEVQGLEGLTGTINFEKDGSMRIPERVFTLEKGLAVELS